MAGKPRDITGLRSGKLTAISITPKRDSAGNVYWNCICDCGRTTLTRAGALIGGHTQSCGHCNAKIEDISGKKYGKLTVTRLCDKRDVNQGTIWTCKCDCGKYIDVSRNSLIRGNTKSCGCLSVENGEKAGRRAVESNNFGYQDGTVVSKIRSNKPQSNTKTTAKGVHFKTQAGKFQARIGFKGTRYHLGYYDKLEDAIAVRKEAEEMMYEPFLEWYYEKFPDKKPKETA